MHSSAPRTKLGFESLPIHRADAVPTEPPSLSALERVRRVARPFYGHTMEKLDVTIVHGSRVVCPRRLVAVGKAGPGFAKVLVVAEFYLQSETVESTGEEAKSA